MAKSIINLSDTIATWVSKTNQTVNRLGDVANLTTAQDSSLVGALNELDSELGTITAVAMGTTADTVSGAIAELDSDRDRLVTFVGPTVALTTSASAVSGAINELDSDMGTRASLITTAKEDLVSAINEVKSGVDNLDSATNNSVGDITNLTTTDKTNLVAAINEHETRLDSGDTNFVSRVRGSVSSSGDLSYNSSTGVFSIDVEEIYTAANFDSDLGTSASQSTVRGFVSATDAGGDGSFSYNSGTGAFTYTGPSASEVRAHFSAGEGIDLASGVISGEDATTTNKGIASFNSTDFSVSSGAVSLQAERVADIVGGMVTSNTESGISVVYQDTDNTLDFDVGDFDITLTGAVTGSGTVTNLGNVSITTTATSDPTLTLSGDVTGSATFTNLGNATLTASLAANTVTSSELSGATALIIYNSAGTAVKTLYGAGS